MSAGANLTRSAPAFGLSSSTTTTTKRSSRLTSSDTLHSLSHTSSSVSPTTAVFTSSRRQPGRRLSTPPLDPVSMGAPTTTMSTTTAILDYGRRSSRWMLSESQLMRHGQGASDLRSSIVQSKAPAGFIRLSTSTPPTPILGPPPSFDPSENLYFPPVVLIPAPTGIPSQPPAPPPLEPQPPAPKSIPIPVPGDPVPSSSAPARVSPGSSSIRPSLQTDFSSSSTLVQSTDMVNNISGQGGPWFSSSPSSGMTSRRKKELSLTEIMDGDWSTTRPPATTTGRRKRRSDQENYGSENGMVLEKRRNGTRKEGSSKEGSSEIPTLEQEMEMAQTKLREFQLVEEAAEQHLQEQGSPEAATRRRKRSIGSRAVEKVKTKTKNAAHKLVDHARSDLSLMSKPD